MISAAERVWTAEMGSVRPAGLVAVGVDTAANRIVIQVTPNAGTPATTALAAALGVPVDVQVGQESSDTHCTTRDHCHAPTYAGIRLYKGAIDSQHECALAFHIRIGADERFVTSGHCGYSGSNNWLHPGIAGDHILGGETGQTLYKNNGQDIMVVQLDVDTEASDNIFACCGDIVAPYGGPIQYETLCVSLAETNAVKCGWVTNTWLSWISDTANPDMVVKGGDLTITTIDGDSGSPVYRLLQDPNDNQARAIGVNAAEWGQFARLDTSLDDWGAAIFP